MIKNKYIKTLAATPVIGAAVRGGISLIVKREAKLIAKHFSEYLQPVVAFKPEMRSEAFRIRHDVYCEELKFEPEREDKMEQDEFDEYSRFCLIQHLPSNNYAGCVRIVSPHASANEEPLPIEKFCSNAIEGARHHPSQFDRSEICEISRLAVRPQFRRRKADKFDGAAHGAINEQTYSEEELRCFPFLAIGLYLSCAALAVRNGINHAFVMMEPRLARSMSFLGIKFEQLGPAIDYHGIRAPYYISAKMLTRSLPVGFQALMKNIDDEVGKGCMAARESLPQDDYMRRMYVPKQKKIWLPHDQRLQLPEHGHGKSPILLTESFK
ncbi:PEP-CTERM/exosortase system-associated acyltransferase [Aliagarivorans marinus]|uniref:PEP-CTERM/exosortase system-associated acyltransferase n=1 Tax=Aliagarivorans marinus TaxID=561965 RepID=UPI00042225E3|nr:PEP-CTERM/exosortase system-associated acyltransferase [Aliagarivorans marinus]